MAQQMSECARLAAWRGDNEPLQQLYSLVQGYRHDMHTIIVSKGTQGHMARKRVESTVQL